MMFEGQSFLITGASSGIGLAAASRMAELGASIVAVGRNKNSLRAAVKKWAGSNHLVFPADISDPEIIPALIAIGRERGGFDGGLLAAGAHALMPLSLENVYSFQEMYKANVVTALNGIKIMNKGMNKAGGAIVLISSAAAYRGSPGFAAYAAAKSALMGLGKTAAVEMASRRIRVNTIIAGVVETPLSNKWMGTLSGDQRKEIVDSHLLGLGKPAYLADAISFLLSDNASWITGTEVVVDGGFSAR